MTPFYFGGRLTQLQYYIKFFGSAFQTDLDFVSTMISGESIIFRNPFDHT